PDAPWVDRAVPLHAHAEGFDLHAAVRVEAEDRTRLTQLCRYLCRPPLGQQRLARLAGGRTALPLQRPRAAGTTALVVTPHEVPAGRVAVIPRPRINLLLYHGVLAPNAPWRSAVVARDEEEVGEMGVTTVPAREGGLEPDAAPLAVLRPRYRSWAELMRRAFATDVLACPRCGGGMVGLATIEDRHVIRRILTNLGLSTELAEPAPSRAPPAEDAADPLWSGPVRGCYALLPPQGVGVLVRLMGFSPKKNILGTRRSGVV